MSLKTYTEAQEARLAERLAKLEENASGALSPAQERRRDRLACAMQRWRRMRYQAERPFDRLRTARSGLA